MPITPGAEQSASRRDKGTLSKLMIYRREIDGLRALAVIPVMLFHAGFPVFSGGFVGVDVFFVISGYLITSLILQEKERGRFSLVGFYERRARRILPALFVVMITCIPFAWLWMIPSEVKAFSRSLVATVFFVSNIFFYQQTGYFDTAAELKPLLHTWSLAVEEQYYLIFPLLFLSCFWRIGQRRLSIVVVAIGLGSLALATVGSTTMPAATFYFLPTRLWELLIGAAIAFATYRRGLPVIDSALSLTVAQISSIAGVLLIAFAIFAFDKSTPFPGLYALIPTIGTALIIVFANPITLTGKILSSKPFVGIGLISYSAYLWHQPMFAFSRLRSLREPDAPTLLMLAGASLILAYFTWRYVEQPFRDRSRITRRAILRTSTIASAAVVTLALLTNFNTSLNLRHPDLPVDYFDHTWIQYDVHGVDGTECYSRSARICRVAISPTSADNFLLIGDSHSGDFTEEFRNFLVSGSLNGSQLSMGGCAFLESQVTRNDGACGEAFELIARVAAQNQFNNYILVGNFFAHTENASPGTRKSDIDSFVHLMNTLLDSGAVVYFFTPRITWSENPVKAASLGALDELKTRQISEKNLHEWDLAIRSLSANPRFRVFDQNQSLLSAGCGSVDCFNAHTRTMYPLFRDRNHLTSLGARTVFNAFRSHLH